MIAMLNEANLDIAMLSPRVGEDMIIIIIIKCHSFSKGSHRRFGH